MTGAILPPIKGCLPMQRNANMLKIQKKRVFTDFIGFFVEIQSPACPPNGLLFPERALQNIVYYTVKRIGLFSMWANNYSASGNNLLSIY